MIDITDVNRKFSLPVEFTRVDKGELLFLDNPKYQEMIARYPQLSGVAMNDKCNLFTHEAPKSLRARFSVSVRSRSNWNLEVLVFGERGKPEYPEKNLSEQGREPTTNSTHISTPGFEPRPHWWEASALTTAPPLLP